MKIITLIFFIVFLISMTLTGSALNLDVDEKLNDFARENVIKEEESQNLTNPFLKKDIVEEAEEEAEKTAEEAEENELEISDFEEIIAERPVQTDSLIERVEEQKPDFSISGIISTASSRVALLINYQQDSHLLKIGDSLDDYRLLNYSNGKATFVRDGEEYIINY